MDISLDTETTGLDRNHGCRPFSCCIAYDDGSYDFWEWRVDPYTRQVEYDLDDLSEIKSIIQSCDKVVLQNGLFDIGMLTKVDPKFKEIWPWDKTHDTICSSHLLASNQPKDLTTLALIYLRKNIKPLEEALHEACKEARSIALKDFPEWKVAKEGLTELPSAKEKVWGNDYWLPKAVAEAHHYPLDHPWYQVLKVYAVMDPCVTLAVHKKQLEIIRAKGLEKIYNFRVKIFPVVFGMEERGITVNAERLERIKKEYKEASVKDEETCVKIAKSYDYELKLPKAANNKSLTTFVFDVMQLEQTKWSKKTGNASLDKGVIEHYEATLPENTKPFIFVKKLRSKRQRDTAVSYLESYSKYMLRLRTQMSQDWYKLYPWLKPFNTDTLRFASSNPNEQNISKKENFNLRYVFGPGPGREWWSCDAQNIELRIPAFEAGETEMIDLFNRPDDPPYFGSYHMLIFDTLHPEKFAQHGKKSKSVYASTWYQWTKNGNFAVQYGAQEQSGTADRAYHVPGAQARIKQRFKNISKLNDRMIEFANKNGYVETMPDKTVDPLRGYPLLCTRSKWGDILPTVPLSYHVQGTAMWWMTKAMIRVDNFLEQLNTSDKFFFNFMGRMKNNLERRGYYLIMQIHDELVFDFPKSYKIGEDGKPIYGNAKIIKEVMRLMSQGGEDLGFPTPVSCEYHADNWSTGVGVVV